MDKESLREDTKKGMSDDDAMLLGKATTDDETLQQFSILIYNLLKKDIKNLLNPDCNKVDNTLLKK